MRRVSLLLSVLVVCVHPRGFALDDKLLVDTVFRAVALLYSQTEDGTMRMHCTTTAFEQHQTSYVFAAAAHCVGNDDTQHEKAASATNIPFYITFDEQNPKTFYAARVLGVGYQHRGDDFALYEVVTDQRWATVPLWDEQQLDVEGGKAVVINVASPLGLGKQIFRGSVSKLAIDRPLVQGDINWKGSMLLQISAGPGSSGSAVVSVDQGAIVGFLVGTVGGSNIVAIPVTKFKKFREAITQNTYKWYAPDRENP